MADAMNSPLDALPDLPNVTRELFVVPTQQALQNRTPSTHAPRILLLYGSLRVVHAAHARRHKSISGIATTHAKTAPPRCPSR